MTAQKTFTFAIPPEMKAALRAIREADGIPEAEQIRRGVQMWLDSRRIKSERQRVGPRKRS
jgi:hypothetical protein